jgi:hypothetical protein
MFGDVQVEFVMEDMSLPEYRSRRVPNSPETIRREMEEQQRQAEEYERWDADAAEEMERLVRGCCITTIIHCSARAEGYSVLYGSPCVRREDHACGNRLRLGMRRCLGGAP